MQLTTYRFAVHWKELHFLRTPRVCGADQCYRTLSGAWDMSIHKYNCIRTCYRCVFLFNAHLLSVNRKRLFFLFYDGLLFDRLFLLFRRFFSCVNRRPGSRSRPPLSCSTLRHGTLQIFYHMENGRDLNIKLVRVDVSICRLRAAEAWRLLLKKTLWSLL